MELRSYGGIYGGNTKATNFLCLTLKMLQIQPDKDIVLEFIRNEDYKYVRLLGAFYLRLVGKPLEIYQYLEPLLNDFRKIRYNDPQGKMQVRHVDEFIHDLLSKDTFCDTALPRIPQRQVLEGAGQLEPQRSALDTEQHGTHTFIGGTDVVAGRELARSDGESGSDVLPGHRRACPGATEEQNEQPVRKRVRLCE